MDEFRTIAKLWPSGDEIDLGADSNVLSGGATFTRNAAPFVTSADGSTNYQFLFWNTGRHTTNKRRVKWIFSVLGWGTWTATRWYGIPPTGGGGPPRVHAEPFSISADDPPTGPTVIDGAASTYAAGAHPWNGNDREIGTSDGAATVVAKTPYNGQFFTGWQRLIWGGDPVGEFVETDSGLSGPFGGDGYYTPVNVTTGAYGAAQGTSHDLIATYASSGSDDPVVKIPKWFEDLIWPRKPWEIDPVGDPGPLDRIRRLLLESLLERTRPSVREADVSEAGFGRILEAVPRMAADELKRALSSVRTSVKLGETVMEAIEAKLKGK
jgi:hypothetical protein